MNCPKCHSENTATATFCTECGTQLESGPATATSGRCYVHPNVETALSCGSCERPICVQCVVQHPVGIRCRECAQVRKIPVFDVSTPYYARAVGAGLGIAVAGAVGLVLFALVSPFGLFVPAGLVGVGYLVGEGIGKAVNRKRSRGLQYIAGGSVFLTYLLVSSLGFSGGLYGLLALAAAIYVAVTRLSVH